MHGYQLKHFFGISVDELSCIHLNRSIQGSFGVGFLGFRPVLGIENGPFFSLNSFFEFELFVLLGKEILGRPRVRRMKNAPALIVLQQNHWETK